MQYLIHYNDKDKAQYSVEEVFGNLKTKLVESINKIEKSEGEKVAELIIFITDREDTISITEFAKYCALNGYWAEFRRSGSIFCKIIEEHNFYIQEKKKKVWQFVKLFLFEILTLLFYSNIITISE